MINKKDMNTKLKMNDLNIEIVSTMKYLRNIVNKTLNITLESV